MSGDTLREAADTIRADAHYGNIPEEMRAFLKAAADWLDQEADRGWTSGGLATATIHRVRSGKGWKRVTA